ncbi:hypothetical protein RCK87_24500, partial [Salmonella enterica subsp. enterica serovar 1,4,[5],12:i:-]
MKHGPDHSYTKDRTLSEPLEGGPERAIWADAVAIRKRRDGGYTIASGHENVVDIVPASFRYGL